MTGQDQFGFCLVSGVPATPEATEELSKRIGFIRETQCKLVFFFGNVRDKRSISRRQVLGIYSRPIQRGHGLYHDGTFGAHRQYVLCSYELCLGSVVTDVRDRRTHPDCSSSIFSPTAEVLAGSRCSSMASMLPRCSGNCIPTHTNCYHAFLSLHTPLGKRVHCTVRVPHTDIHRCDTTRAVSWCRCAGTMTTEA